ncbi:MAG: hypothetical protein IJB39_00295 [Alistipes sp.]|nr:hypothetical protein [Alistipes sp.]
MKYFSKLLSMFLLGAMLLPVGCTDYDEDIQAVNDRIDDLLSGEIEPLKADLATAVASLEAAIAEAEATITEKHNKDIEALRAADAELDGKIAAANTAIANLAAALEAAEGDIASLQGQMTDALAAIEAAEEAIAALNGEVDGLKAKDAELAAELAELTGVISQLRTELVEMIEANKAAIEENAGNIEENAGNIAENAGNIAENAGNIAENAGNIAENAGNIAENAAAIEALEQNLADHIAAFTEYQTAVDTKIAALEARVAAAEAAIKKLEEETIPAMKAQIETNKALSEKNAADIAKHAEEFAAYQAAVQATFDELVAADEALNTLIATLRTDFEALKGDYETFKSEFDEYKKAIEDELAKAFEAIAANATEIAAVKADLEATKIDLQAKIDATNANLSNLAAQLEGVEAYIMHQMKEGFDAVYAKLAEDYKNLNSQIDAVNSDLQNFKSQIEKALALAVQDLQTLIINGDAAVMQTVNQLAFDLRAESEKAIAEAKKALQDNIDALDKKVEEYKAAADELFADHQAQINALLGRVQSLVFVPEYTDGMATIDWAKYGNSFVEGKSELTYSVYPAECASAMVGKPELFTFDLEALKTRSENAPAMTVVGVVAGEKAGQIVVEVEARNFGEEFYLGGVEPKNYAASLVLKNETANIASTYTNLVASKNAPVIELAIYDAADKLLGVADVNPNTPQVWVEEQTISYTKLNEKKVMIDGHYVAYHVDGEKVAKDAIEYAMPEYLSQEPTVFGHDETIFNRETNEAGYIVYSLVGMELDGETVGNPEAVGKTALAAYCYKTPDKSAAIMLYQSLVVTKELVEIDLGEFKTNWNYATDAKVDASLFDADSANDLTYNRRFVVENVTTENLPADLSVRDVVGNPATSIKVNYSGATTDAGADIAVDGDQININVKGFTWDSKQPKTYDIVATYELPNVTVTVTAQFTTVDRSREAVEITLPDAGLTYTKDLEFSKQSALDVIYNELNTVHEGETLSHLGVIAEDFTAAEFLKDIFVTNAMVNPTNTVNGKPMNEEWKTNLKVADDGQTIAANYTYKSDLGELKIIEGSIKLPYVKTFTTYYGQEVTIKQTIWIGLPKYDFVHSQFRVENDGVYFSNVTPAAEFDAFGNMISFSVANVDMDEAFAVVKGGNILDSTAMTEAGIVTEFYLEGVYDGITITNNEIAYNGAADYVDVAGRLYIVNSNGTKVELPTSFANTYKDYQVRKFDPIRVGATNLATTVEVEYAEEYSVAIAELINTDATALNLYDYRDGMFALMTGGNWVSGGNGFDNAADVIYGLNTNWAWAVEQLPAEMAAIKECFSFDNTTGVLTFDNSAQLELVKPVEVTVTFTIDYTWGSKEFTAVVTFKQK